MTRATFSWLLTFGLSASGLMAQEHETETRHEGHNFTSRVIAVQGLGRGFLGVRLTPLTPELRTHFGVPEDTGVMVARVEEGGPAEAAGILVGDILSAIDGERLESSRQLARAVRKKEEGDVVTLELYRNGSLESYVVTVSERDREVVDLAGGYGFMRRMDDLGEAPDHDVVIRMPGFQLDEESMEAFQETMEGLGEHFDSAEWQEKIERIEGLDFTTIQERMKEVERRLQELEQELEKEGKKDF